MILKSNELPNSRTTHHIPAYPDEWIFFALRDGNRFGAYSEGIAVAVVVGVITYFPLVLGELVPKRVALSNSESIAILVAPIMEFVSRINRPFVSFLSSSTEFVVRLLGIKSTNEPAVTEEEVKILIEQGRETGVFEDVEQEIIERVFRLSDRSVNSLMTHRSEMVWLDVEDPLEENIKKILTPSQTNFVVCRGTSIT